MSETWGDVHDFARSGLRRMRGGRSEQSRQQSLLAAVHGQQVLIISAHMHGAYFHWHEDVMFVTRYVDAATLDISKKPPMIRFTDTGGCIRYLGGRPEPLRGLRLGRVEIEASALLGPDGDMLLAVLIPARDPAAGPIEVF